jgi:hypothetical protein
MRTRQHQAHAQIVGAGGLGRDDIGLRSAGRVGSCSGGSWLRGRRGGCGIAFTRPLIASRTIPLDLNSHPVVQCPTPPN